MFLNRGLLRCWVFLFGENSVNSLEMQHFLNINKKLFDALSMVIITIFWWNSSKCFLTSGSLNTSFICLAFTFYSSSVFFFILVNTFSFDEFKLGSHLQKKIVICLIESPIKMMKYAFYFILKALFVLKIFKFLSRIVCHVGKTALSERFKLASKFMTSHSGL